MEQTSNGTARQMLTIEQLVTGLSENPHEASDYFEEIIRRFEPLLRNAWRHGAFSTDYSEYIQDVFLTLFRRLPYLRSPKAFPGYFRRVALSVAADHARKSKRVPVLTTDDVADVVADVDESLFTEVFVRSYLEHLPAREREVLSLNYLEDLPMNEIARKMNLSIAAARSLKSRAINRLRQALLADAESLQTNK